MQDQTTAIEVLLHHRDSERHGLLVLVNEVPWASRRALAVQRICEREHGIMAGSLIAKVKAGRSLALTDAQAAKLIADEAEREAIEGPRDTRSAVVRAHAGIVDRARRDGETDETVERRLEIEAAR